VLLNLEALATRQRCGGRWLIERPARHNPRCHRSGGQAGGLNVFRQRRPHSRPLHSNTSARNVGRLDRARFHPTDLPKQPDRAVFSLPAGQRASFCSLCFVPSFPFPLTSRSFFWQPWGASTCPFSSCRQCRLHARPLRSRSLRFAERVSRT
jgi:hypothetical protein